MAFNARRYSLEFAGVMAAYTGVLFASRAIINATQPEGILLWVLAIIPIIPTIGAAMVFLRHYATMDELQQRIQVQAFAVSGLIVGLMTFALGFMEGVAFTSLSYIWVMPAMLAVWGIVAAILRARLT